jgi:hypothetical protein
VARIHRIAVIVVAYAVQGATTICRPTSIPRGPPTMKIPMRPLLFALTLLGALSLTACKTTEASQSEPMQKDAPMPADGTSTPQPTPAENSGTPQTSEPTTSGTP